MFFIKCFSHLIYTDSHLIYIIPRLYQVLILFIKAIKALTL